MKNLTIKGKKVMMEDEIEEVTEGIVKGIGNGAMIMSSKKYIGKKVYVLVRKQTNHTKKQVTNTNIYEIRTIATDGV